MDTHKAIIIDDEIHARTLLKGMLKAYCPEIELVADCPDLATGVKAIVKNKPEIVFLDIEMPGHSGLELLDFFEEENINFSIIFTTAYDQYALKAIKMEAVDYLLKPIEPDELEKAVVRFKKNKKEEHHFKENLLKSMETQRLAIPTSNGMRMIDAENILYLKADNTYTEIMMTGNQKHLVSRTLKNFEDALRDFPNFFRCSKSYIVNLDAVEEYSKSEGGYLLLKNKSQLPISSDKVDAFWEQHKIVRR
ncbi:MAG: LytR/AlgR family response regulator transcription factor [Bacteroidales bacterium]